MAEKAGLATRFTNAVVAAYQDIATGITLTENQRALMANYYVAIDEMLKNSKQGYKWSQVRMNELATAVSHLCRLNIDPRLPGMVSFLPFRVKDTGTIHLVPCLGWKGLEFEAKTYGVDPPKTLTVELVYSNDKFSVIKKDAFHESDSYTFEIANPFDRGKVVGAFALLEYDDKSKNKVMAMSVEELMSYRPDKYDPTFWQGSNLLKMYEKIIAKQILKKVPLDSRKTAHLQSSFKYMESEELVGASLDAKQDISEKNGVGDFVDVDYEPIEGVENPVEAVEDTPVDENEVVTPEDDVLGMNERLF